MALAEDTLLPTLWGWTSVKDLQAGDQLFDELGYPCRVTEVSEPYLDPNALDFAVGWGHSRDTQGWGTYARLCCSADTEMHTYAHHWLKYHTDANIHPDWPKEARLRRADTVADTMVGRVKRVKGVEYPTANHRIPITRSLQIQRRDLPIPPYALGVLINYYNHDHGHIDLTRRTWTNISNHLHNDGVHLTEPENLHTGRGDAQVKTFLDSETQRKWDRIVASQERADYGPIPIEYLRGSEQQRMDLLSGLLDTYHANRNYRVRNRNKPTHTRRRQITFEYRKSRYTVNQVAELVRTLGWPAFVVQRLEFGRFTQRVAWHPEENILPSPYRRARESHLIGRKGQPLQSYVWSLTENTTKPATLRRFSVDSPYGLFAATSTFLPVVSDRG
jgi:hypothetical protein